MRNLGIKAKIWVTLAVFAIGYLALLGLLQWTASQTQKHMQMAAGSLFPAALQCQGAETAFGKLNKRYQDAVLMQDKNGIVAAQQDAQQVLSALQIVEEKIASSSDIQQRVASLVERFNDIEARSQTTYTLMVASSGISASTQQSVAQLARDNKEMADSLAGLRGEVSSKFQAELDEVTRWSQLQRTLGVVVFVIALACGGGLGGIVLERQIVKPLRQLVDRLKDIAEGEGDLSKRLNFESHDEIGQVGASFNVFMDKLQVLIKAVAANIHAVAAASEELSASSQQITANSEQTSAQANVLSASSEQVNHHLQTVATGSEEMTSSIKEIARNAHDSAKAATAAVQVAIEANEVVSQLGDSSTEIGQVIKVITSIAQQTNLLALNATIEAARAGEAGKGFAVVANEVKELAKQTAHATEDISRKLQTIQENASRAIGTITHIGDVIKQVNDISNSIAAAVEQQNSTTNEISRNITEAAKNSSEIAANITGVAAAAQNTAQGAGHSAKAAQSLAGMSSKLQELVSHFRVESRTDDADTVTDRKLKAHAGI